MLDCLFKVVRCADFEALKTFKKKLRSNLKNPNFHELNSGENTALFKDRLLGDVCAFPSVSFEDAQSFVAEAVEKKNQPRAHSNGKREGKGWIPFVRGGKSTTEVGEDDAISGGVEMAVLLSKAEAERARNSKEEARAQGDKVPFGHTVML